jgi:hypothetical protein
VVEARFGDFLRESFEALRRERPAIYDEMCRVMQPRMARIEVDGGPVDVQFAGGEARIMRANRRPKPAIEVRASRDTILGMVDARWSLMSAIAEDRLLIHGLIDDLIAFHDGLTVYLHGAVRAPSFPDLLRRFRRRGAVGRNRR